MSPLFVVDMPGYGFAEAPKAKVEQWTRLVRDYLRGRATLVRVFLLVDARHGLKPPDLTVMQLMDEAAVSYQAVLTKVDKIKPAELVRVTQNDRGGAGQARGRLSGDARHVLADGSRGCRAAG